MTQASYKYPIDCSINNGLMKYLYANSHGIACDGKNLKVSKLTFNENAIK